MIAWTRNHSMGWNRRPFWGARLFSRFSLPWDLKVVNSCTPIEDRVCQGRHSQVECSLLFDEQISYDKLPPGIVANMGPWGGLGGLLAATPGIYTSISYVLYRFFVFSYVPILKKSFCIALHFIARGSFAFHRHSCTRLQTEGASATKGYQGINY